MHIAVARLVSMSVIFAYFQHRYIFIHYLLSKHHWTACVRAVNTVFNHRTPANNRIKHIVRTESLDYIFAAGSMLSTAAFSNSFVRKPEHANHDMPIQRQILMQNGHSGSFKVIHFGVTEKPLSAYILHYNNFCLVCESSDNTPCNDFCRVTAR